MLIGEYAVAIGDKNRIALPKKLRVDLTDNLIITRGYEGCALVLDQVRWSSLIENINERSLFSLNVRDTKRYLLGGASEIELDKQGRFVIPDYILQHIKGENDLIFLGVGEWIELWSKVQWEAKTEFLSKNASDIAERLANR